jgi:hypothetical protein
MVVSIIFAVDACGNLQSFNVGAEGDGEVISKSGFLKFVKLISIIQIRQRTL